MLGMPSCKEISRLVTASLDCKPPLRQRLSMRLHFLMCSLCARFHRQILFLRDARARIKHALRDEGP
jgi:hypothetical protein